MDDGLVWDSADHRYVYRHPYDGPMGIFEDYDEENDRPLHGFRLRLLRPRLGD